jgi:predicted SAM-dependent methyltransferase
VRQLRLERYRASVRQLFKRAPSPVQSLSVALWRWITSPLLARKVRLSVSRRQECKLHIGAGPNALPGWLNTDINPGSGVTYFLDAVAPFPFDESRFDYVYSEHVIEHVPYEDGMRMLAESFRTLKPGGKIRLATPDLSKVLSLYRGNGAEHEEYRKWALKFDALPNFPEPGCFIVNHFMRAWGHCFIYDEPTLTASLQRVGFVRIRRFQVSESDDPNLTGIEQHARLVGDQANLFETMVLQAEKPDGDRLSLARE